MRKKIFLVCILLMGTIYTYGQTNNCNCPKPADAKFMNICTLVENKDMSFIEAIQEMACADKVNDSKETIKTKVNCMWDQYYTMFGCTNSGFMVEDGNVLKLSVTQEFDIFVDGMVKEFGVNINKKDPVDGKTLLDFVADEIERYKHNKYYSYKSGEIEKIYNHFKNDLGALHVNELPN